MKRLWMLAAGAVLATAVACSDSSGPGGASSVALLVNTNFVQYDTSDYGAEGSEMQFTFAGFGVAVDPVTDVDSTSLAAALQGNRVFVVPEEEGSYVFADSLTPEAMAALRFWVDSTGGTLIVVPDDPGIALLDSLFGYSLAGGSSSSNYPLSTSGAAGTPFAGGPSTVWDNDGTYPMAPGSLPGGAKKIYQAGTGDVAVAVVPQGRGTVVLLAWDWYNAEPHGSQDGGWTETLRRALRF